MGKSSGGGSTTQTIQKSDPWSGAQPYLTDIMRQSQNLYNTQGAIPPYPGDSLATMPSWLTGNIQSGINTSAAQAPYIQQEMFNSLAGALNPQSTNYWMANAQQVQPGSVSPYYINPNTSVSAQQVQPGTVGYQNVRPGMTVNPWQIGTTPQAQAQQINPGAFNIGAPTISGAMTGAAGIQGSGINPNQAINYALYGNGMSPFLDAMAGDIVNRTQQQWGDVSGDMWRQLQQSTLPGISDEFQAAGSLGASRQGLLQGQAIGLTNEALAREYGDMSSNLQGTLANLYGGAYENAQGRSASLASQLAGLGSGERTTQAQLLQQALLANAGFGQEASLANQSALMQAALANQGTGMQGALANQGASLQAALANQGVDLQALLANQGVGMQAQGMNLDALLKSALANQQAGLQAGGLNLDALMQAQQLNQASSLQAALANQSTGLQGLLANQATAMGAQGTNLDAAMQAALANQGTNLQAQLANQATGIDASKLDYQNLLAQIQAGQMLPGISQYPMSLGQSMLGAYAPMLGEQQSLYDLARSGYYESALAPYEALLRYAGVTSPAGGYGGTTTGSSTSPTYGGSPLTGALGGAATGFGLWSQLGSTGLGSFPALLPFTLGGALLGML